jgi:anti-sigma factor RsiW
MSCDLYSPFLQDYLDRELGNKQTQELELHLQECKPCQEQLEQVFVLKELLHCKFRIPTAPTGLAKNVCQRLRESSKRPPSSPVSWLVGVFVLLFLLGFLVYQKSTPSQNLVLASALTPLSTELIQRHEYALKQKEPWTKKFCCREKTAGWFKEQMASIVTVPEFQGSALELCGARCCRIENIPLAIVFFQEENTLFSLFIMPREKLNRYTKNCWKLEYQQHHYKQKVVNGFTIIYWEHQECVYAMVLQRNVTHFVDICKKNGHFTG